MMNLYPAIDLYEGQVVRLQKGDYAKKTVYSDNPGAMAKDFETQGAKWLHLVDLEGAKLGQIKNWASLEIIRKNVTCKLEFGGGIRTLDDLKKLDALGINRMILGTKALEKTFLEKALAEFGSKIAVGLDIRNGLVQTQGWLEAEALTLENAVKFLNDLPVETLIYTDIQKDGMLQGPNFEKLEELLQLAKARIILSGGVARIEDIEQCSKIKNARFDGVIIGKALYEKRFTLKDAVKIAG